MKPGLIYVLYGSDRFTRDEQVRGLKRRMLAEPCGEYNLSELSGREFGVADVRAVADTLPFMAERRLVVVEGLIGRLAGSARSAGRRGRAARTAEPGQPETADQAASLRELLRYLSIVPPTTALVFVEDQLDPALVADHISAERAHIRAYERPRPYELVRWIERRVRHHGGRMELAAARQLAQLAPEDLGLLDNEVRKLVTYADGRAINVEDVELLAATPDVTVFRLIDAIADGERGRALALLRSNFQRGERPEAILPQIGLAFRRLVQARELLDHGYYGLELQRQLGVHPFQAEKIERQARGYRVDQLEAALQLLLKSDLAIKTGEAEPELALELFIAHLPRA
ncbi:MAG TPA: DNA polymerase III subunit delta [Chloroflexota bacterium]|nr:DNA polymerase III subunit delta [Chloroflexota bacterium]